MKFLIAFLLIVILNVIQVFLRQVFDFYPDSLVVTILFGALIGVMCLILVEATAFDRNYK